MVVNWTIPALSLDVFDNCISGIVNTDANDLDLVAPVSHPLLEHIFIMLHWGLAWWAPCGPEIDEPHLTCLMLECDRGASGDWNNVLNWIIHAAGADLASNLDINILNSLRKWLNFFLECINCILFIWGERLLNVEELVILNLGVAQRAHALSDHRDFHLVLEAVLLDGF